MSLYDLVLIVLVGAGAFYAGYHVGRLKALSERPEPYPRGGEPPLAGPDSDRPYADSAPSRPRGAPPPSSAGDSGGGWSEAGAGGGRTPPRRSSKPPPAAAGLMGTGAADKSDRGQK